MRPRITTSLLINQLAYITDTTSAPTEIVLDLTDMFPDVAGKRKEQYIDISDDEEADQRPQSVLADRHWPVSVAATLAPTVIGLPNFGTAQSQNNSGWVDYSNLAAVDLDRDVFEWQNFFNDEDEASATKRFKFD